MRIALVLPGSIWYAPYLDNYKRILRKHAVTFDTISWNREGNDIEEGYQYNVICKTGHKSSSLSDYLGYIRFVKKTLMKQNYDKIVVFGPQMTCLLSLFVLRHYRNKYIIDYRDLSIEQKKGFKQLFSFMMKFSFANVISSPGFKQCLPKRNYVVSHNFDADAVNNVLTNSHDIHQFNCKGRIEILTIGAIRDFTSNVQVLDALANKHGFVLSFVGRGNGSTLLAQHCNQMSIENVSFKGFYQKNEEEGYVKDSTFLNIFYPRIITHDTALSNRFYNSLIYKRPMIVTKGTTQGYYAEKYNVGVAIDDCQTLEIKLKSFLQQDYDQYADRCNKLLLEFMKDQEVFEKTIESFIME